MIKINDNIPGWMSSRDLRLLGYTASIIKSNSIMIEIGSFIGRSSWAIASNLPQGARLHCIDVWDFTPRYDPSIVSFKSCNCADQEKVFATNLATSKKSWRPVFDAYTKDLINIIPFQMNSNQYEIDKDNTSIIFIDGGHNFADVDQDLRKYNYNDEILLLGDDYTWTYPGVIQAVCKWQSNRVMIRFPKSKLWFLWPTKGYYIDLLSDFYKYSYEIY